MPKIVHITTVHSRYDVRIFHKQCRSAACHGYDLTLIVQDGKGDETLDGVKIRDLGDQSTSRIRRIFLSPLRAYRFVRSVPGDVVHFHDPELLPVGFLLKFGKRRVVYDAHEDVPRQIMSKHWIHPALRKAVSVLVEILENYVAKRLDSVVCATPTILQRFKHINPNSIDIRNYPIQEELLQLGKHQSFSRTICYVGCITRERGITELTEALEILGNVTLIMCGPFESNKYSAELKSMPGWKFVDYRGVVGRNEVRNIMACSPIGIVTFLPTPNQIDSYPIKMFEYMSAGLPVIASNFQLWRQILGEGQCGICVDPSSPEDIARGISTLLSNETLCREKGAAGKKAIAARFNWRSESEKLLSLYERISCR